MIKITQIFAIYASSNLSESLPVTSKHTEARSQLFSLGRLTGLFSPLLSFSLSQPLPHSKIGAQLGQTRVAAPHSPVAMGMNVFTFKTKNEKLTNNSYQLDYMVKPIFLLLPTVLGIEYCQHYFAKYIL